MHCLATPGITGKVAGFYLGITGWKGLGVFVNSNTETRNDNRPTSKLAHICTYLSERVGLSSRYNYM